MAAGLVRTWKLPALRCQPLGQLGRRLLHQYRHPGHAGGVKPLAAPLLAPRAVLRPQPSRGMAAAATAGGVAARGNEEVNEGILEFYDDSTSAWEKLWGPHMHHGFYDPGVTPTPADNIRSLVRMMEEAVRFAGISDDPARRPKKILDVGCGMGGGTIYLAKRFGAQCDGINLSPSQIARCRELAAAEGADNATFHLADAMEQPFPDGHFNLVWCMEAAEHVPDKEKFFSELVRVAAPGGTIVITSMCHRDPETGPLKPDEEILLQRLCEAYHHGSWFSVSGYVKMAESLALQDIKTADWSESIMPFWPGVMQSAMTVEGSTMLLESGLTVMKSILMAPTLVDAFKKKLINYSIITCQKPW